MKSTYKNDFATNTWQGAAYESGLDNSPMYDSVSFSKDKNMLALADVGLMSVYNMDCESMAEIAVVLNKQTVATELRDRATKYRLQINTLWHQEDDMYNSKLKDLGCLLRGFHLQIFIRCLPRPLNKH